MTILFLFDFSKAFNSISPDRLLRVMSDMGFSRAVLCWISTYINGRRRNVISKNEGESDWRNINLGVPQGKVLGPLLFSLYINNIQHILKVEEDEGCQDNGGELQHFFHANVLHNYLQMSINQLESGVKALPKKRISYINKVGLLLSNSMPPRLRQWYAASETGASYWQDSLWVALRWGKRVTLCMSGEYFV